MDILILAVISGVAQLAAHYIPWKQILHRKLKRTEAYIVGVLLMMVPFSVWLGVLGLWRVLLGLWIVIVTSGGLVIGAYALDHHLMVAELAQATDAENKMMRGAYFDDKDEQCS